MILRFLRTTASASPEYPFQAGQRIHVTKLTAEMRVWIKEGAAEVERDGSAEVADQPRAEQAITQKGPQ